MTGGGSSSDPESGGGRQTRPTFPKVTYHFLWDLRCRPCAPTASSACKESLREGWFLCVCPSLPRRESPQLLVRSPRFLEGR